MLRKCVGAGRALAASRKPRGCIPNQDVLINSIPLREARDSSAIENIVTTNDTLFKFANADPEKADDATKEALRYRTALMQGFKDVQESPLSTRTAVLVCRAIKNVDLDIRQVPGTALAQHPSGKIVYTPPEGQALLREKLSDLEQFLHGSDDTRSGHPHGCRRTTSSRRSIRSPTATAARGASSTALFLIDKGLLDLPILYLSRYINEHRANTTGCLLAVTTKGAWEAVAALHARPPSRRPRCGRRRRSAPSATLMDATVDYVSAAAPKIYSRELIEVIFTQPYSRIGDVVEAKLGIGPPPANT